MLRIIAVFCCVFYVLTSVSSFVRLYDPGKPISSATTQISLTGRSKRHVTSNRMARHYDVTWMVEGRETRARLTRSDSVGELLVYGDSGQIRNGRENGYKRDWGTYKSDDVDGVFLVHRHPHNYSAILVEGYFIDQGRPVLIQPRDTSGVHVIHTLNEHVVKQDESILNKIARKKRVVHGQMILELRVFTDVALLAVLDKQLGRDIDRDDFIAKHYAMLISFMNKRLETLRGFSIRVNGVGLHILRKPIAGVMSMHHGRSRDGVRATACDAGTLDRFEEFLPTSHHNYDHAMLYTGYDLLGPEGKADTNGLANTGLICHREAASIVEFLGSMKSLQVATHELGHSLGAQHDGETSLQCREADNYIMRAADSDPFDDKNAENWWRFSTCSATDIERNFLQHPDRKNCLLGPPSEPADTFQPLETHYGSVLTRNEQCQIFSKDKQSVARPLTRQEEQVVCSAGIVCNVPSERAFNRYLPYDGMPCGPLKWCDGGKCVTSKWGK